MDYSTEYRITHCIICCYLKEQHSNKLHSEHFTRILYSIVIHPCKVQIVVKIRY